MLIVKCYHFIMLKDGHLLNIYTKAIPLKLDTHVFVFLFFVYSNASVLELDAYLNKITKYVLH